MILKGVKMSRSNGNLDRSTRSIAGLQAKRKGDQFERILNIACRMSDINLIQIPMGAEVRKVNGEDVVKKKSSPFDFIATKMNLGTIFFDAKSRAKDSISYSDFWSSKSTKHQSLTLASLDDFGERAGFVVWFRASDKISFIPIEKIVTMEPRTSFGPCDGIDLGSPDNFLIDRLWNYIE